MKNKLFIITLLASLIYLNSCNSQHEDFPTVEISYDNINEFEVALAYLENAGNYINSEIAPALVPANEVFNNLGNKYFVIDIRSKEDYLNGHIPKAVNVDFKELYNYFDSAFYSGLYQKVVIVDYSGQTASYAASLLRAIGHGNVFAMKFGMSGWGKKFAADRWLSNVTNDYANLLDTVSTPKNAAGSFPTLETGKHFAIEILEARVKQLFEEGAGEVFVTKEVFFANATNYYTVSYLPIEAYAARHIPNSVQYTPKKSLLKNEALNTLPTDKPSGVYCYSGHHGAYVAGFLRILGYNAQSLLYGANGFMNNYMKSNPAIGKQFEASALFEFPTTTGEEITNDTVPAIDLGNRLPTPPPANNTQKPASSGGC